MPNPATPAEAIGQRLLAADATALAALIDTRAYPSKPTQEPDGDYVSFWQTGGGEGTRLAAASGLLAHEMRVEATATTQAAAAAILQAIRDRLHGWRDRTIGVHGCFAVGDADEFTQEDGRQVSGQTFTLWFKPE